MLLKIAMVAATMAVLVSCGGGGGGGGGIPLFPQVMQPKSHTVSGVVSGLAGKGLVLQNNGAEAVSLDANGSFTFPTPVSIGAAYAVAVKSQPSDPAQLCTVNAGVGTMADDDVRSVSVVCSAQSFAVGGTVIGLNASGLVLQNNSSDDVGVDTFATHFTFGVPVAGGAKYGVTVKTQPSGQFCSVNDSAGTVSDVAIDNVKVVCADNPYSIGGSVRNVVGVVILQNNAGDDTVQFSNGPFTFPTKVASGAAYAVTARLITSLPMQTCTVNNGSGVVGLTSVTNVDVSCTTVAFKIKGTVTGLAGSGLVLQNNAGDDLTIAADGQFDFVVPVGSGSGYAVSVKTQPKLLNQICTVANGAGVVLNREISSVTVTCITPPATYAMIGAMGGQWPAFPSVQPHPISSDGTVSSMTAPMGATTSLPTSIAVDSARKFLYATDDDKIYQFRVAAPAGVGLGQQGFIVTVPGTTSIRLDPLGRYAVSTSPQANGIYFYAIDSSSRLLTTSVSWPSMMGARATAIDPTGRFVYSALTDSNSVAAFVFEPTGVVRHTGNYLAGSQPWAIAIHPTGKFLYVANRGSSDITVYAVDPTTGSLGIATTFTADRPKMMTFSPDGKYLYAAEGDPNLPEVVAIYVVNPTTGALTSLGGLAMRATTPTAAVEVDPTGRFLFVLSQDRLETYLINRGDGTYGFSSELLIPDNSGSALALSLVSNEHSP